MLGGAENIAGVNVTDSPGPLFDDPPGCLMLKQGSFARNWMVDLANYTPEKAADLKLFPFPTIDGNTGAMGGGDTIMVFNGTPENAQIVKDWITPDWECTLASFDGGGVSPYGGHGVEGVERLPANRIIDVNCLESDFDENAVHHRGLWTAMADNVFVFDGRRPDAARRWAGQLLDRHGRLHPRHLVAGGRGRHRSELALVSNRQTIEQRQSTRRGGPNRAAPSSTKVVLTRPAR